MCGIFAAVGRPNVTNCLIEGLKMLEYRGYDSSGVATLVNGNIEAKREVGKLINLENHLKKSPLAGTTGIAHIRWASHGIVTTENAHPLVTDRVAVVHNGIIENYQPLKAQLIKDGYQFKTETDTEVVAQLLTKYLDSGLNLADATAKMLTEIEGAYALAILISGVEDTVICARKGSPLAIGHGLNQMFIGSDAVVLSPYTNKVTYLAEGDWAILTPHSIQIFDESNNPVQRPIMESNIKNVTKDKGNYRHFMLKEIHEQPTVILDTLKHYIDEKTGLIKLPSLPFDLAHISRITVIACGTSYYSAMVAKYWIESLAHVSVDIDIASEFRYRKPVLKKGELAIFVSQSGETADTLAALKHAKTCGQHIMVIVNQVESSMAREADVVMPLQAGLEIGVASTKAFTCQLAVLAVVALATARAQGKIDQTAEINHIHQLLSLPTLITEVLAQDKKIEAFAQSIAKAKNALFLGRGTSYPLALEGALKLKEISYIHAEGYAAGEMKHGPIALIDEDFPTIVVCPTDELFDKTVSNVQEIMARKGPIMFIGDAESVKKIGEVKQSLTLPKVDKFITPFIYSIPLQLIAYYVGITKGCDVDQPRNLAKSVTIE